MYLTGGILARPAIGWLDIFKGASFGGLGLLKRGGEGGKFTNGGDLFFKLSTGGSSSTKLTSASGLDSPIFFKAAFGWGYEGGGGPWLGGRPGRFCPGKGLPLGPTLIKMGFNLPPYSWGAGKVPRGLLGYFKWGRLLRSGTGGGLGLPFGGGGGGPAPGGGGGPAPGGVFAFNLSLSWGPSGSALLLFLFLTKAGIRKSKKEPPAGFVSCFLFLILSGLSFILCPLLSCPWAMISGVTLGDGGGFPSG